MRLRSVVKRDLQVSIEVRSAAKHRASACDWVLDFGRPGSKTSVKVSLDTSGSSSKAEARAWPMKPPAPVIMQLIL